LREVISYTAIIMKAIITGGAGFIGSHLADALLRKGNEVIIIDNLSTGKKENIPPGARFILKDILKEDVAEEIEDADVIFHMAADPDVRLSAENPAKSFELNLVATFRLLESCRKADVERFVLASTSTVYGDAELIPTPEDYPCAPISNYGASKLACEGYCSAYAHSYGIRTTILRYANIFGERSTHGVMHDFYKKLKKNPSELEILGDGRQEKSYLYINDTILATLTAYERQTALYDVYNVGSRRKYTVNTIARMVCNYMGLKPKFTYTGGARGWVGDVRTMLLDVRKLERLGWKESTRFEDGMKAYLDWLALSD